MAIRLKEASRMPTRQKKTDSLIQKMSRGFYTEITLSFTIVLCSAQLHAAPTADQKVELITSIVKKATQIAKQNATASAEYHFSLAQAYGFDGDLDRAIEEYQLALAFDPKSAILYTR